MMSKTLIVASVLAVALSACNKKDETAPPASNPAPATSAPAPSEHAARQFAGTQHRARRRLHHAQRLDHSGVLIRRSADPRSVVEE